MDDWGIDITIVTPTDTCNEGYTFTYPNTNGYTYTNFSVSENRHNPKQSFYVIPETTPPTNFTPHLIMSIIPILSARNQSSVSLSLYFLYPKSRIVGIKHWYI